MEKRSFPGLKSDISLLGFGLMRLPVINNQQQDINYPLAEKMVDHALEKGVNYFDTAYIYHEGKSELFAGAALSRHPRNRYQLATKMPTWLLNDPNKAENIFEQQLKNCHVDYFDFYLIHNLNTDNYKIAKQYNLYEFLAQKKKNGAIRHLGFSLHDSPEQLQLLLSEYEWDFVQIQLNYIDWDSLKARELYEILYSRNIPVIVMEPVRGGALANLDSEAAGLLKKYNPTASEASWAIRYAASLPGVMTVLSGMTTPDQLEDNLQSMTNFSPLNEAERKILDEATKLFRASNPVPCTSCRYCMDCPSGVNIPNNFGIYNQYRSLALTNPTIAPIVFENNYRSLKDTEKAYNCVACGECQTHCPQKLDIPSLMKEISALTAK